MGKDDLSWLNRGKTTTKTEDTVAPKDPVKKKIEVVKGTKMTTDALKPEAKRLIMTMRSIIKEMWAICGPKGILFKLVHEKCSMYLKLISVMLNSIKALSKMLSNLPSPFGQFNTLMVNIVDAILTSMKTPLTFAKKFVLMKRKLLKPMMLIVAIISQAVMVVEMVFKIGNGSPLSGQSVSRAS